MLKTLACILLPLLAGYFAHSQQRSHPVDFDSTFNINAYVNSINKKTSRIERKLSARSRKYFKSLTREELRLNEMLKQLDPDGVEKRAMTNINFPNLPKSASYVPALDSFKTGLKFLEQNKMLFDQWIYAGAF
jgi:hypothetical protein